MAFISAVLFNLKSMLQVFDDYVLAGPIEKYYVHNKESTKPPIILVHGSGGSQFDWKYFFDVVTKQFNVDHPVYAYTLDAPFQDGQQMRYKTPLMIRLQSDNISIEQYAYKLQTYIDNVISKHQARGVYLVCHSMGGLVARYCDTILNNADLIIKIFTISSPHQGAPLLENKILSKLCTSRRYQEMAPDSEFLSNDKFNVINVKKYMTYGGTHDMHVPESYSRLGKDVRHKVIDGCCHLSILYSDVMWRSILKKIRRSEPLQ